MLCQSVAILLVSLFVLLFLLSFFVLLVHIFFFFSYRAQYAGEIGGLSPEDPLKKAQAVSIALGVEDLILALIRFLFNSETEEAKAVLLFRLLLCFFPHSSRAASQGAAFKKFQDLVQCCFSTWTRYLGDGEFLVDNKACRPPPPMLS